MHYKRWRLYGTYDEQPRVAHNRATEDDFWNRLVETSDGCLEYPSNHDDWGYGVVRFQGKVWKAHRLAYYLTNNELPEPMCLHTCDNPPCCNPEHLYAGTGSNNMEDMYLRNRGNRPTGFNHHMVKYTEADAILIKELYTAAQQEAQRKGLTRLGRGRVEAIAKQFNISVNTVRQIVKD